MFKVYNNYRDNFEKYNDQMYWLLTSKWTFKIGQWLPEDYLSWAITQLKIGFFS